MMNDQTRQPLPEVTAPEAGRPSLVLVSTPIGNLQDMSPRAVAALRDADAVLCEDTRTSAVLASAHGIRVRLEALHEHNEQARIPALIAAMQEGRRFALISDAGTPLIADPGYRLTRAAIEAGLAVSGIPGPNAAVLALALSGLPPHPFLFGGFLPPRQAARRTGLAKLRAAEAAGLSATFIFYEAPHRLAACLADCAFVLGDRPAAVTRELTKRFEEVRRDSLAALAAYYQPKPPRGEITLVIGPAPEAALSGEDFDAALDKVLREKLATLSLKDAAAVVSAERRLPRKLVYARALALTGLASGAPT
jgi:16S rRNA (cytidine1402-2'-O)-methyltransferase